MKLWNHRMGSPLLALLALVLAPHAGFGFAQDEEETQDSSGDAAGEPKSGEQEEEEETEEDRWFAIAGGDVYTGTGAVLRHATILSKNGKIVELGYDVYLPEGCEVLDASGYRVYPGLVAVSATNRISRGSFGAAELDVEGDGHDHGGAAVGDPLHPDDAWARSGEEGPEPIWAAEAPENELEEPDGESFADDDETAAKRGDRPDFEHDFDPFSSYLVMALSAGITTAEQSGVTAKLKRGELDGVQMKEKYLVTYSWSSSGRSSLREKFKRAAEYLREMEVYEEKKKTDKSLKEPDKRGVDTSVVDVLQGRKLAKFNAHEAGELLGIARFAQTYRFRPVIEGCREGWTVAEELGRAGAYAVVTPRERRTKDERLVRPGGSSIENAAILHRHGVQVAIIPGNTSIDLGGITGRDLLHFPVEAGFAVRGGMTDEEALSGITLVPARIMGVDHRVGSLEIGKDMDAIVTDGDVLHYQTFVQWAVVEGKTVYDKQKELLFHHIRPRPEPPVEEEPETEVETPEDEAAEETSEDEAEEVPEEEGSGDEESEDEGDGR